MAEYIDKDRLILCMSDWMLQNAPVKAGDDTTRADTILDAIKMVEDSPAANVRENVIRTNADRIRAMDDEELAKWLWNLCCLEEPFECPAISHPSENVDCKAVWLDWLKSPVGEDDDGGTDT